VLSYARGCLPGLSATHKHGVTGPDEVLKYIKKGKWASKLSKDSNSPALLQKILFVVQDCEEAEVMDAILQLDYYLGTIKLFCLSHK